MLIGFAQYSGYSQYPYCSVIKFELDPAYRCKYYCEGKPRVLMRYTLTEDYTLKNVSETVFHEFTHSTLPNHATCLFNRKNTAINGNRRNPIEIFQYCSLPNCTCKPPQPPPPQTHPLQTQYVLQLGTGDKHQSKEVAKVGTGDKSQLKEVAKVGTWDKPQSKEVAKVPTGDKPQSKEVAKVGSWDKPQSKEVAKLWTGDKPQSKEVAKVGNGDKPRYKEVAKVGNGEKPKKKEVAKVEMGEKPKTREVPNMEMGEKPKKKEVAKVEMGEKPKTREVPNMEMGEKPKKKDVPKVGMREITTGPFEQPPQRNVKFEKDRKRCSTDTDGKHPHKNKRVHRDACVSDLVWPICKIDNTEYSK